MTLAQAVVSSVPWYGQALITGCFVVIGATIGLFSAYLVDRRKQRREDRQRWDKDIWESSSRFLVLCLRAKDARFKVGEFGKKALDATTADDITVDRVTSEAPEALEWLKEIKALNYSIEHELYSLSCIAPPTVWRAAIKFADVVTDLGFPVSKEDVTDAVEKLSVAQAEFLTKLRFSIDAKGNNEFGPGGRWATAKVIAREKIEEMNARRERKGEAAQES
ncbi:hypothetical protein GV792_07770 [Nocardia cyriacigeorgica]|uniref:hypothetical protein n=1 Tax=Nocardia cyriacigeorgica TaxID=135487 RepID=UPI0013B82B2B|nr:hypothetical protein [Nocardia cyriacigeorgica]NEW49950.1 hypothetical protein [Nocardia cyriacigeorgica]